MSLRINIPHTFKSKEDAIKRTKDLVQQIKVDYGEKISNLEENWNGNTATFSFTIRGYTIAGTAVVTQSGIDLEGDLPWALSFFKGKIEKTVKERAQEFLNKK
jgi:hypothetical protein